MEDIIKSVTEAEERAAKIKEEAEAKAAAILADAEKKAEEIIKRSEQELKLYRENALIEAAAAARKAYEDEVARSAREAAEYADGLIKNTGKQVADTVGRIKGGNS